MFSGSGLLIVALLSLNILHKTNMYWHKNIGSLASYVLGIHASSM
jgi:hypothetical protein